MRCSSDLRKRVLGFVAAGGRKAEAAERFQVGIASVYRWLKAEDGLAYRRPGPRGPRRLDWEALRAQVKAHPDWTLRERAGPLRASRNGVWHALQRLGVSRKKTLGHRERDPRQRRAYGHWRDRAQRRGKVLVHVDESGFAPAVSRRHG